MSFTSGVFGCLFSILIYNIYIEQLFVARNNFETSSNLINSSSLWCSTRIDGSKLCSFKNLYYLPRFKNHIVFLLNNNSILNGIKSSDDLKNIGLSTIRNHSNLNLKLIILKSHDLLYQYDIDYLSDNVLVMKRFKPDNIMHVIHDDLIPLFLTYKELCMGDIELCLSSYKLFFFDHNDSGPFYKWYNIFSYHNSVLVSNIKNAVCLQKGVIGLSHESVWFQYGFKTPQGPLLNSPFNGLLLEQFTKFIKQKYNIMRNTAIHTPEEVINVILLSRKINRKILNEINTEIKIKEICQQHFNRSINMLNMDVSTNSSQSLISHIEKTDLLIGMHGSAMILSIFLPPKSIIVELFPFGIEPKHVSPIKALSSLDFMSLSYYSWVNKNESNTKIHPEYPPLLGGLAHLPLSTQANILNTKSVPPVQCCHNSTYLFRMFQDTIIDNSLFLLLKQILIYRSDGEKHNKGFSDSQMYDSLYFPPPVFNLTCKCINNSLKLSWNFPFSLNNIKFSVATSTGIAAITNYTNFSTVVVECSVNVSLGVWVKTLEGQWNSVDTYTQCI